MVSHPSAPFSSASSPVSDADSIWEKVQEALNSKIIRFASFVVPASYLSEDPSAGFSPEEFALKGEAQLATAFFRTADTVFALVRTTDFDGELGQHPALFLTEVTGDDEIQRQINAGLYLGRSYFLTGVSPDMALQVMDIAQENDMLLSFREDARHENHLQIIEKLRHEVAATPASSARNSCNHDM